MKKKVLIAVLCVAMLAIGGFATWAYLTDEGANKNTFTVGNVDITLDEADVDGTETDATTDGRDKANKYHLLPGQTYAKDPTVTVTAKSEDCYVRMLVEVKNINNLKSAIPADANPTYYNEDLFLLQMMCGGWDANVWEYAGYEEVTKEGVIYGTYEFRYANMVAKADTNTVLPALFSTIKVPRFIDNVHLAYLADVEINVTAHAIQAVGFGDAAAAWGAWN